VTTITFVNNQYWAQCRLLHRHQYAVASCFQLQFLRSPIKNLLENIILDEVDVKTFLKEITLEEEGAGFVWLRVTTSGGFL